MNFKSIKMNVIKNIPNENHSALDKLLKMTLLDVPEEILSEVEFKRIVYEFLIEKEIEDNKIEKLKSWLDEDALLSLRGMQHIIKSKNIQSVECLLHYYLRKKELARKKLTINQKSNSFYQRSQLAINKCIQHVMHKRGNNEIVNNRKATASDGQPHALSRLLQVQKNIKKIGNGEMDDTIGGKGCMSERICRKYQLRYCMTKVYSCR